MAVLSNRHRAYAHIRQKMVMGELTMGAHLSEEALAKEIGVSRTPVREALNRLGTEGLLEHAPNCGAFVKKFSRQEIWELFELREVLEGYAAARAATRLGPEQLEEMQHLCDEMLRMCRMLRDHKRPNFTDEERRRFSLTDATFHRKVIGACGNERVKRLVEDFGLISKLCNRKWPSSPSSEFNNACWTWGAHARILRSLKKHDGEGARRWMSDHINRGEAGAMELYDDPVEPTMIPSARTISSKDQLSVRYRKGAR